MYHLKFKSPLPRLAFVISLATVLSAFSTAFGNTTVGPFDPKRAHAMDDDARVRLNAAIREMKRRGIRPRVNSTFRSQAEQRAIYRCASSRRCRTRRGVYGANKPGTSMHEAGLAVDLGGIAAGRKRRLTPKGRQAVHIMRKHGFAWRYGLKDPAHFEMNPRQAGYRTERAAIRAGQLRWLKNQKIRRARRDRA